MKNYKKIYNRLIEEIKKELKQHEISLSKNKKDSNTQLIEYIEDKYGVTVLEWILSLCNEIEGKECQMILMNKEEFNKWKKKINKKG